MKPYPRHRKSRAEEPDDPPEFRVWWAEHARELGGKRKECRAAWIAGRECGLKERAKRTTWLSPLAEAA